LASYNVLSYGADGAAVPFERALVALADSSCAFANDFDMDSARESGLDLGLEDAAVFDFDFSKYPTVFVSYVVIVLDAGFDIGLGNAMFPPELIVAVDPVDPPDPPDPLLPDVPSNNSTGFQASPLQIGGSFLYFGVISTISVFGTTTSLVLYV